MAESQNLSMEVRQSTSGGASLEDHWKGAKGLKTLEILRTGAFSRVVLQDHSMASILEPEKMLKYGKLLAQEVPDAEIYLFMTWARKFNTSMQATVTAQYQRFAGRADLFEFSIIEGCTLLSKDGRGDPSLLRAALKSNNSRGHKSPSSSLLLPHI